MENDELLNAGQEGNYRLDIIDTNQKVIHSTLYRQHLHDVHRFCTIRPPLFLLPLLWQRGDVGHYT